MQNGLPTVPLRAAMTLRTLFVDFNSYFASVEQQEHPELRGCPIGVVPVRAETTCCIAASSEAKLHGVRTGTRVSDARQLCPGIRFVVARPRVYVNYHQRLRAAIETCLPIDHVGSIDEMSGELIGRERQRENAIAIAERVRAAVFGVGEALGVSVGIAPNAYLAKTASDMQKPHGLTVLELGDLPHALHRLELRDLCGIGSSMEHRLHARGIHTVTQLCAADKQLLRLVWGGIEGERMFAMLRGDWLPQRATQRSSVGHSHVLAPELREPQAATAVMKKLLLKAAMRLRHENYLAGAMSARIKYLGGTTTWQLDVEFAPSDDSRAMLHLLSAGLQRIDAVTRRRALDTNGPKPLSVAVSLQRLVPRAQCTDSLFAQDREAVALNRVIDTINKRYGGNKVYFGGMQLALAAAPMRIPFQHLPDTGIEDEAAKNLLWHKALNKARRHAETAHLQAAGRPR